MHGGRRWLIDSEISVVDLEHSSHLLHGCHGLRVPTLTMLIRELRTILFIEDGEVNLHDKHIAPEA